MELKTLKAKFAVEFIDLPEAAQVEGAFWEPFQIGFLNNSSRYGIDVKGRQIAWSFTAALDAFADSRIEPGNVYQFVSINQDEANEKIRYLKAIREATDAPVRPKIVRDSLTYVEFDDKSRFVSHPCRPPRGKPKARIYLDEMAHYPERKDREIYTAALPATSKGNGYIRIGSSPLGAKGLFWEIATESMQKWPGYNGNRHFLPWWNVRAFCKDVKMARQVAPALLTQERVYAFGTQALIEIYENMFLEDFQQEFECAWMDEVTAWITWEMIQSNQREHDGKYYKAENVDDALALIDVIRTAMIRGDIEDVLVGGIDVGRKHDKTELIACGKGMLSMLPVRIMVTLRNTEFDDQERVFKEFLTQLPFTQVLVDRNGLGMQLAEALEKTGRAQGVDFTNATKELWAVQARIEAERRHVPLPMERDLAYQIHSIKKYVTDAKNIVFDADRNTEHHADKFWAWALAIWAGAGGVEEGQGEWGESPVGDVR